MDKNINRQLRF